VAHEGQTIQNPRTGQRITFLELREELMRCETINPPGDLPCPGPTGRAQGDVSPRFLQLVALLPEFSDEIRPVSPPWPILRALATALGPVARARGYQGRLSSS
jgi:hypothetical protein